MTSPPGPCDLEVTLSHGNQAWSKHQAAVSHSTAQKGFYLQYSAILVLLLLKVLYLFFFRSNCVGIMLQLQPGWPLFTLSALTYCHDLVTFITDPGFSVNGVSPLLHLLSSDAQKRGQLTEQNRLVTSWLHGQITIWQNRQASDQLTARTDNPLMEQTSDQLTAWTDNRLMEQTSDQLTAWTDDKLSEQTSD